MNAIVKTDAHSVMESVLIKGDLSRLTPEERNSYYRAVCTSVGLNPLTKPLEYITLNGKLRLYALKDCTDQLRSIHKVSVTDMTEAERDGVYIVKCKVQNAEGRTDMAIGAVNIANLKGEALANAMMKTETKSKRRATLSICGLGMLDETEVDDIPASAKAPVPSPAAVTHVAKEQEPVEGHSSHMDGTPRRIAGNYTYASWTVAYIEAVQSAGDAATVYKWIDANRSQLEKLGTGSPEQAAKARAETEKHLAFLRKTDPISSGPVNRQADNRLYREEEAGSHLSGDPVDDMPQSATPKTADDFPGDTPMEATEKPKVARGRPKGSGKTAPNMSTDYDGWVSWYLKHIIEAETPEVIESLFDAIDSCWDLVLSPDRESLIEARADADRRMEQ